VEVEFIKHALERIAERGASIDQVKSVLEAGESVQAKTGRRAKEAIFEYNSDWLGKRYRQKKVKVVYVEEADKITVITVYVYFGYWG